MDRDKLLEDVPIFLLIGVLFLLRAPFVPNEYKDYLFWGGMVSAVAFILGTEYVYRITASKFLYVRLIVRPWNIILHCFVTEPSDGIHSRLINETENIYETPLTLGENLRSKRYPSVRQIVLKHDMSWEKRFIAMPGKAQFRGYSVDHSRTATMTVWTPKEGPTIIDHLEVIPIFVVAEAPRDYYIEPKPFLVTSQAETGTELQVAESGTELAKLRTENASLKSRMIELERYGFTQHRLLIRIEGEFKQIKNEFRGALSRTRDVSKLVLEELLTVLSAHTEIEDAVNEYRKRPWIQITVGLALLVLGIFGMYEYSYNQDFRQGIQQNVVPLAVIAVCLVFVVMFLFGRRRSRS
jgi:hypothetical protein